MTIAQGLSSLPGFETMNGRHHAPRIDHKNDHDRWRFVYMPAFVRQTGTDRTSRKVPRFELDWFSWMDNTGTGPTDAEVNIRVDTGPIINHVIDVLYREGDSDWFEVDIDEGTSGQNVSLTISDPQTVPATTETTKAWSNGTDANGDSPPIETSGYPVLNRHMRLPADQAMEYGPTDGELLFGFLRFQIYQYIEEIGGATFATVIEAIHVQEINDGTDSFSDLIGEALDENGVDTPYHETMPVSAYSLRHFIAMVDRYSKEARYNQTVIMGELYDVFEADHV